MAHDLKSVLRIRELRARLAQLEAARLRQELLRAQIALADAYGIKAAHEANIDQTNDLWMPGRIAFVAGERIRVRNAEVQIRRAKLSQQQAQVETDDASKVHRSLLVRCETLSQELARSRRKLQLRRIEREDQNVAEDRATLASAQRANSDIGEFCDER